MTKPKANAELQQTEESISGSVPVQIPRAIPVPVSGSVPTSARKAPQKSAPTPARKRKAREMLAALKTMYPDADCELTQRDPWQLLCAVILSAQCTDVRVNATTPSLFARYPDAASLAVADSSDVEAIIKSTGFFREKTKSLIAMSQDVVARYGGSVPQKLEELVTLRGVGRKTANVIIGTAFGGQGVVVDTHVKRLSGRLGWTKQTDPVRIEQDLMALFPQSEWTQLGHSLVFHGRRRCTARSPQCADCPLLEVCPDGRARMRAASRPAGRSKELVKSRRSAAEASTLE